MEGGDRFRGAVVWAVLVAATGSSLLAVTPGRAANPGAFPDFDGDGYADLVVSVPFDRVGSARGAGSVHVLYGSASGTTADGDERWTRAHLGGVPADGDRFGTAWAAGDFDADGFDDLAIGIPHADVNGQADAGAVVVVYGGRSGLDDTRVHEFHQDTPDHHDVAETGDRFGLALAAGDFDGDGFDDLAVGVPLEDVGAVADAGFVALVPGDLDGLGPAGGGNPSSLHRDTIGVADDPAPGDLFGFALVSGDFDADGSADLAVGVPADDHAAGDDTGTVQVFPGDPDGPNVVDLARQQLWHRDVADVAGTAGPGDRFGAALATGDFDADGASDLAVSAPVDTVNGIHGAGSFHVFYGASGSGLGTARDRVWHAGVRGVLEQLDDDLRPGRALGAGDFDADGAADIVWPARRAIVGGAFGAGRFHVLYGTAGTGITAAGDQVWHRNTAGIQGVAGEDHRLGTSVTVGDFDGDGNDDVAVGGPGTPVNGVSGAGSLNVLYGSRPNGLHAARDQLWHRDKPGVIGGTRSGFGGGNAFGDAVGTGD